MDKHTPGPWKAVYVGSSDWDLDGPTTREDWTLAAAAPDLLKALETCEAFLLSAGFESSDVYAKVCASIAKATGEQS
jgi:hypothetical protein